MGAPRRATRGRLALGLLASLDALIGALCDNDLRIHDASGLIAFSVDVNDGTDYEGTTVYLDSDIDFTDELSQQFEPIGKEEDIYFLGTFDGQGYAIRNLTLSTPSPYVGLFGNSDGTIIRNVVIDDSCSVTNSLVSEEYEGYTGSIIGICNARDGPCTIESVVNMADVSFTGKTSDSSTGGLVGLLYFRGYDPSIKNCANYGTVTNAGVGGSYFYLGGIAGQSMRSSRKFTSFGYVRNCANYGTVVHRGTSIYPEAGGILGYGQYTFIDNCVSSGPIVIMVTLSEEIITYVGSIAGSSLSTPITHCYWNKSIEYDVCGLKYSSTTITDSYPFDPSSFELKKPVSIGGYSGTSLVDTLNSAADYYFLDGYSHWALNRDSRDVSFTIKGRSQPSFTTNARFILLPDLASEGSMAFNGWYTDSACTKFLSDFTIDSDEKTSLYGLWYLNENSYTISFDTQGGSDVSSITSPYGSAVELPTSSTRDGCAFLYWETEYGYAVSTTSSFIIPARNITLYAAWLCERITTARDLITFSNTVNAGTNFSGTTIYLDDNIDFTGALSNQFKPIGKNTSNFFLGTFNGQGHAIRNLALRSSGEYVGLFGYSAGTTIRNVVLDETCSVTSIYDAEDNAYIGSIIAHCSAVYGPCAIENNVNMAGVTFDGNTTENLYTGGIVGFAELKSYNTSVKNCANYGAVTITEACGAYTYIGGVVGSSKGVESDYSCVQNCANYGSVLHSGTPQYVYIGGVAGNSRYATIDNCLSSGPIATSLSRGNRTGSIVGYVRDATISRCYWNMSLGYKEWGYKQSSSTTITDTCSFDPSTLKLTRSVSVGNYAGTSLIDALNGAADYHTPDSYSHWALNRVSRDVSFTVNGAKMSFRTSEQVILLPDLASEGSIRFDGWYTDSERTRFLLDYNINNDNKTDLYGLWCVNENNYTINFETKEGSAISPITSKFLSTVELPTSSKKDECVFLYWETGYRDPVSTSYTVRSHNITLYAVWLCGHITTTRELIAFSNTVNAGTNFMGMTIYLDSDIDFTDDLSSQFEPIGKDFANCFRGTFDGQGHVVRNLALDSPNKYVGLFGYSAGTTIRNVVLDETCSFVNIYDDDEYEVYTGSVIGECDANVTSCTIENSVNMGDVTFDGNMSDVMSIGGIAGSLYSSKYKASIRNCANYGTVADIGTSGIGDLGIYIGGIVGSPQGNTTRASSAHVQNCVNYGTVLYGGTTVLGVIGGISGFSYYSTIENCVSSGPIVIDDSSDSSFLYVAGIVGYASNLTTIAHCYWTSDVGCSDITAYLSDSANITNTTYVERLNTTTLDELNAYVTSYKLDGFSQWVMLHLNGGSINNLNQSDLVVAQKHFPSPAKEGNTFLRWCKDLECGKVYDNDLTGVTALYAVWETVCVTFAFWNGTKIGAVNVEYGSAYGALPEAGSVVEGHTLCWFISNDDDEGNERIVTSETIVTISSDHTLHGRWVANNYTVTLDLGNGTVITRTLQYNEIIELPQGIAREGCTHTGWDNSNTTNMPAMNITINALWNCTQQSSGGKSKSSSNTGAIVGGVIGGIIGVVIIVFVVLFFILFINRDEEDSTWKRATRKIKMTRGRLGNGRGRKANPYQQPRRANCGESFETGVEMATDNTRTYEKLYPTWYNVSTMQDALTSAGLSQSQAKSVVDACDLAGRNAEREGKLPEGFTSGDAAAIAMYTYSFDEGNYESNPYRLINEALMGDEEEGGKLDEVKGLLYLVMCSLRRLPRYSGKTLYRGVKEGVDKTLYKKGNSVVWHGLSSTSPDMNAVKSFLADKDKGGKAVGTLFIINNGWGYDVQPYSLFPEEAEILLEPEREFKVQSVIEAELTIINLEMVDTPVILPEIFGEDAD